MGMPIVIHSRDADKKTMDILKEEETFSEERCGWFPCQRRSGGRQECSFTVSAAAEELGREYVKGGGDSVHRRPITYKNNRKTVEMAEDIPIEYLLVGNGLTLSHSVPFRGRPNKPPYVEHTVRRLALIKGLTYEETARRTMENAKVFLTLSEVSAPCFDIFRQCVCDKIVLMESRNNDRIEKNKQGQIHDLRRRSKRRRCSMLRTAGRQHSFHTV